MSPVSDFAVLVDLARLGIVCPTQRCPPRVRALTESTHDPDDAHVVDAEADGVPGKDREHSLGNKVIKGFLVVVLLAGRHGAGGLAALDLRRSALYAVDRQIRMFFLDGDSASSSGVLGRTKDKDENSHHTPQKTTMA